MRLADQVQMAWRGVLAHPARSLLTMLGIGVGIAAVVLLTSIGQGVRGFVLGEFTQFGTNLLGVTPGRTSTFGMSAAVVHTTRPLSLEDADALAHLPRVVAVAAVVQGNADVEWSGRRRQTMVLGVGAAAPELWRLEVAEGRFFDMDATGAARAQAVLGAKLRRELFGDRPALGQVVRIGGERYRAVGVMAAKGQLLGFDMDDTVYVPTERAMRLFDLGGVHEIDLLYAPGSDVDALVAAVRARLTARHGQEDFTIITQEQMLDVLDSVLGVLTEVGLLRALGAGHWQVLGLFLGEAVALAALGGALGLVLGVGGALLLGWLVPAMPVAVSPFYLALAEGLAVAIGLLAGVVPARRAAGLEPVQALRTE
jgi:putative ABC transport system permease protein